MFMITMTSIAGEEPSIFYEVCKAVFLYSEWTHRVTHHGLKV